MTFIWSPTFCHMLAVQIRRQRIGLMLFQYPDNMLLVET